MLQRLQAADDPVEVEFPKRWWDAGYPAARERVLVLRSELESWLGISFEVRIDGAIQDATFFSSIFAVEKDGSRADNAIIALRFSNFGNLFTMGPWVRPHLPEEVVAEVIARAEAHGFAYVPGEVLEGPYTGANPIFQGRTWLDRFFNYIWRPVFSSF